MDETLYIESSTSQLDRLTRIGQIIEALELRQVAAISNSDVSEYSVNDGQIVIRTIYRSPQDMAKAIEAYEKLRQKILNKLNGRGMVLRPSTGLVGKSRYNNEIY